MAWGLLVLAGIFEVGWSLGLKFTNGFTNLVPSLLTILAIIISMGLLARAAQDLPISTAYAVWVGIGTIGAAIGGAIFFQETLPPMKIFFLSLLLISIIGLKLSSDH